MKKLQKPINEMITLQNGNIMIVLLINITSKPVPEKYIYRRTRNGRPVGGRGGGGGAGSSKVSGEEGCMQAVKYHNLSGISHYDRMRRGS